MPILINGVIGGLVVLYPIAVYFGIEYLKPWQISAFLLLLLVIRLVIIKLMSRSDNKWSQSLLFVGIIYCLSAILINNTAALLYYPVLISFSLLMVFSSSLFFPPPIIERLARLQHPDLPEQGVRYTRKVTQVWSMFFFINGCIALATALWGDFAYWSLYNGLISYLLMALLMGVEYLVRIRTQTHLKQQVKD